MNRRRFLGMAAVSALGLLGSRPARAQKDWPTKPVRVVVGYPAGGLTDILARVYSEYLGQRLAQPFIVENRPGAGSILACQQVAKAAPDGYTFLFTISTAFNQNRVLYRSLPYDPDKDFTYVSGFHPGHLPLAVSSGVKATDIRQFVEMARRERVTMGTYSPGSYPHMVAQQLNKRYGTQIESVHYRGEAPMWVDVASGQLHAGIGSIAAMASHLQSGKLRPIAVPSNARSPRLPEVPTFAEQGYGEPVFMIEGWVGMFGPAALPKEIVDRISALNQEAAEIQRVKQINTTFGLREKPWTADEFEKLSRESGPQWIALARELGVTLD